MGRKKVVALGDQSAYGTVILVKAGTFGIFAKEAGIMSIYAYGRIKRKCIDEDFLERILIEFFSPKRDIVRKNNQKCVTYEGVKSDNNVIISFISEKKPPYNVYDTNIINDEFEYVQLIIFDIKKEEAAVDTFKDITINEQI